MKTLAEAVAERRELLATIAAEIATIAAEIAQFEGAAQLIGELLTNVPRAKSVKPPLAARAKPVRAEKKPSGKQVRTKPGDTHFVRCGHLRSGENLIVYGTKRICRACKNAAQLAYLAKKAGKPRAPKPAEEPDPAPPPPLKVVVTAPAPGRLCPMLDSGTGKRCSLAAGHTQLHQPEHGKPFSKAASINIAEMGGSVRRAGG